MQKSRWVLGFLVLTAALFALGGESVLAGPVHALKAQVLWSSAGEAFQLNDHYYGVGVEVEKPVASNGFDRWVRYLDLGVVEHLREDRRPHRAEAWVNGELFKLEPTGTGDFEVLIPSTAFHLVFPNTVTVLGFDDQGNELAVFEMGACRFL